MSDARESPGSYTQGEPSKKPPAICRHLGISNDPDTYFQYASTWNFCHRPDAIRPLATGVQGKHCLTANHVNCPVFQAGWDGRFPRDWVARSDEFEASDLSGAGPWRTVQTGVLFFLLITALALLFGFILPSMLSPDERNFPVVAGADPAALTEQVLTVLQPTETPVPSPTSAPTEAPAGSPTPGPPSATPEPLTPTETPLPTDGPGLGTPFGPDDGFVIHVVLPGESYLSIANRYSTTPEVIQVLNPSVEGTSLWVDDRLVVPIGAAGAEGLPVFTTFFTTEAAGLTALADLLGTDPELLRYYNQLGDADLVPAGRWLIVPLPEE